MRTLGMALVVGLSLAGCVAPDESIVTIALEENDLGITEVEIQRELTADGALMTVRGLDGDRHEVARATVRTGLVFDPEAPVHNPGDERPGREIVVNVGDQNAEIVQLHRSSETRHTIQVASIASFLALEPVAAAVSNEASLRFEDPEQGFEAAFATNLCSGSKFPFHKVATQSCCNSGAAHSQKIPDGANINRLGYRQYGAACTMQNSTNCVGTACQYGPCGTLLPVVTGTITSVVFSPTTTNPALCGTDPDGVGGAPGTPLNYNGTSTHPIMPGAPTSCPYLSCAGANQPILIRTLNVMSNSNNGAVGDLSTAESTNPHPNVNVPATPVNNVGIGYFIDNLSVTVTATPTSTWSFAQISGPFCNITGAAGTPVTCVVPMNMDQTFQATFDCVPGQTCP